MKFSLVLVVHICGAILGLLSGTPALFSQKGSRLHRASGNVFFSSMLAMTASAVYIAVAKQQLINIIVGVLTFYLVATGWAAIKRNAGKIGLFELGALFVALADVTCAFLFGWQATISADGLRDGYPAAAYFVFGSIALLAAALDVNMLIRGGLSGAPRIARHLWRMCFAFLITVLSFFIGKQRLFPDAIVRRHLNAAPVLLVAAVMFYWLFRVLLTNRYKKGQNSSRNIPVGPRQLRDSPNTHQQLLS
jgi:uncharacterized membrane protein